MAVTSEGRPDWCPASARGLLRLGEPMSEHSTWGVGGMADVYYEPLDREDLGAFLAAVPSDVPVTWIGRGSNLLVRDGGLPGVVINPSAALSGLERLSDDRVAVGAGVLCPRLALFASVNGLSGVEFMAGVPGCVGGALRMNAGAFGGEVWHVVERVEVMDRGGRVRSLERPDFPPIDYRYVGLWPDTWFTGATMKLTPDATAACRQRLRGFMRQRRRSQPVSERSCGSVFRNPPGDHAARLIDACGLRGKRVGGAMVSEQHANFIINTGAASASDIETLMGDISEAVRERFDVALRAEVCVVGAAPAEGTD